MATNWTNVTDATTLLQVANTNTNGLFWASMLIMVWIVMGLGLMGFGFYPAILASSFSVMVIGMLFVYMGLVNWTLIAWIVALMIGVFLWIGYSSSKYN